MCQALSGFALFITAPYLCTAVKIFIVVSVLLAAFAGYIALEVLLRLDKMPRRPTAEDLLVSVDINNGSAAAVANLPSAGANDDEKA